MSDWPSAGGDDYLEPAGVILYKSFASLLVCLLHLRFVLRVDELSSGLVLVFQSHSRCREMMPSVFNNYNNDSLVNYVLFVCD